MEENKTLITIADTFTDDPYQFSVSHSIKKYVEKKLKPKSFKDKVFNLFGKFDKVEVKEEAENIVTSFKVKSASMGTLNRISKEYLSIESEEMKGEEWAKNIYERIVNDGYKMATVLALAITNTEDLPDESLINLLYYNVSAPELENHILKIQGKLNLVSFISSIISTKRIQILKVEINPTDQGS